MLGTIVTYKVQCFKLKQSARPSFLFALCTCPKVFEIIVMNYIASGLKVEEHIFPKHSSSL